MIWALRVRSGERRREGGDGLEGVVDGKDKWGWEDDKRA